MCQLDVKDTQKIPQREIWLVNKKTPKGKSEC